MHNTRILKLKQLNGIQPSSILLLTCDKSKCLQCKKHKIYSNHLKRNNEEKLIFTNELIHINLTTTFIYNIMSHSIPQRSSQRCTLLQIHSRVSKPKRLHALYLEARRSLLGPQGSRRTTHHPDVPCPFLDIRKYSAP